MPDNNKQNDQKRESQGQFTDKSSSSSPGHTQGDKSAKSGMDKPHRSQFDKSGTGSGDVKSKQGSQFDESE